MVNTICITKTPSSRVNKQAVTSCLVKARMAVQQYDDSVRTQP
jgi:hypothetical protein